MTEPTVPLESLLAHSDWVRSLAARLVQDPSLADDVTQRVWVEALERPPTDARNLRGWLTRVAQNAARQLGRGEGRRRAREERAARPEATPSTADLVARANLQRELVGEVLALDEPYRSTVLLRFYEGLSVRAVAERMGCPVGTTRARLRRGLERLRGRLDGRYGDRGSWCTALLPLATVQRRAGSGLIALLVAAGVIGALAIGWHTLQTRPWAPSVRLAGGETQETQHDLVATEEAAGRASQVQDHDQDVGYGPTSTLAGAAAIPAVDASRKLHLERGQVFDERGNPLAFFDLTCAQVAVETDGQGNFEVEVPERHGKFAAAVPGWSFVLTRRLGPEKDALRAIVAMRARRVSGIVLGQDGLPLAEVDVQAMQPSGLPRFPLVLHGPSNDRIEEWSIGVTGDDGRFSFPALPDLDGLILYAYQEQLQADFRLGPGDVDDAVLSFRSEQPAGPVVEGLVLDHLGAPVADARVDLGWKSTLSDAGGRFRLALGDLVHRGYPLTALAPGIGLAVLPRFSDEILDSPRDLHRVDLVMDRAHGALALRVLDAKGAGAAGFETILIDGTPLGSSGGFAEERLRSESRKRTDGEGRLRLDGLLDRPYRLRLWHQDGRVIETGALHPSPNIEVQEIELHLPAAPFHENFRGRVVDLDGEPIEGVTISTLVLNYDARALGIELGQVSHIGRGGGTTTTDAEGRFVFERLPRAHVVISFGGPMVAAKRFDPPEDSEAEHLFELTSMRRIQLEPACLEAGDQVTVLDAQGMRLNISYSRGSRETQTNALRWDGGEGPVLRVPQTATALEVTRGRELITNLPLVLRSGVIEEVSW